MTHSPAAPSALETMRFGATVVRPLARITAALVAARTRQAAHRTHIYLLDAEEHLLNDIGLTRADLRRALTECDRR